ncbi:hypothetical protein [Halomarina ordinaria]|uniref:ABC-2 type transport system permease protein n=1 Tax=Halomarina ordinaria TaxID=3033939 RepID=A0ABD5UHS5_9EURY|nr:hypothetical protein [Halomarina sp. PSRA2]
MSATRHVRLVARHEVVRRWRAVRGNTRQALAIGASILFGALFFAVAVFGAYAFGGAMARGEVTPPLDLLRLAAAAVFAFAVFLTTIRAVQTSTAPPGLDGLLTTLPHREVIAALALVEVGFALLFPGSAVALVALAFAVGAGAPATAALLTVAVVGLVTVGALTGVTLGLAVRVLVARSALLSRLRTPVAVGLFLAYFAVITSQQAGSAFAPVLRAVGATPLGWFADLGLYGLSPDASAVRAAGALGATAVAVPLVGAAASALAGRLWYDDPVQPEGADEAQASGMGDVTFVPRPMARVVRKSWLRAKRNPMRLQYVAYPLFFLWAPLADVVRTGTVPPGLAALVAFYGAWATGSAFSLNPVGDEGPVLPVTLTTPVTGRTFVGGVCLAGVLVGVPLTALAAVGLALAAGLEPAALAAVGVSAVVLPLAATGIAAGVGSVFPRLQTVRLGRNRQAVVPSLFAFALYSLVLGVAGLPASVVGAPGVLGVLSELVGLPQTTALVGGLALTVVLAGVAAAVGVRVAVTRFEGYTYD